MANCKHCGSNIDHKHKGAKYCDVQCMSRGSAMDPIKHFHKSYKVTKNGCWEWVASRDVTGYGRIKKKHYSIKAHRLSWQIHNGEIPDGMFVCHKCDNPPCVNPEHLFIGNIYDNLADMDRKGRRGVARGEARGNAKLTVGKVKKIFFAPGVHQKIADNYGISRRLVGKIKKAQVWQHVTRGLTHDHR